MKNIPLYCGSFDPVTLGHIDIMHRAIRMFGHLTVGVAENPTKKYMFNVTERMDMIRQCAPDVTVVEIKNLTADWARVHGVTHLVKGARSAQDFDYERLINEVTLTQQRNLETVLLFSDIRLGHVSSSAAKELAKFQGLTHNYVPMIVKCAIEKKLGQRIIGVTGTIGSGKSTLCKNLATQPNIHHINMDEIGHQLFTSDLPIAVETRERVKNCFGTIDRKAIGDEVFGNSDSLKILNDIFRDPVLTLLRERLFGLKGTILLEGALLVEMDWLFLCNNQVILVKTPSTDVHRSRLSSRGHTTEQIDNRIRSQYNYDEKLSIIMDKIIRCRFGKCIIHDSELYSTAGDVPIEESESYKYVTSSLV